VSCVGDGISRCLVASCGFYLAAVASVSELTDKGTLTLNDTSFFRIHDHLRPQSIYPPFMAGWCSPPPRPTTPSDPTLLPRSPPWKCRFPLRSFGPAAAPDIKQKTTSIGAPDDQAGASPGAPNAESSCKLVENFTKWESGASWYDGKMMDEDPTWVFGLMLVDYSQAARDNVERAMDNLLRLQEQVLGANADPPDVYADEIYRRMRFDLLEDRDALQGATFVRVRQCYLAYLRELDLWDDTGRYRPEPQRYHVCLVLDASKIEMLVNLPFRNVKASGTCKLSAVDVFWRRPETTNDPYRGVREIAVDMLIDTYEALDTENLGDIVLYNVS
jgi:hypothetical protein